jgi:hypothetical protein
MGIQYLEHFYFYVVIRLFCEGNLYQFPVVYAVDRYDSMIVND